MLRCALYAACRICPRAQRERGTQWLREVRERHTVVERVRARERDTVVERERERERERELDASHSL